MHIYTDPGTEKGLVGGIQGYLRADGLDEYAWSQSIVYLYVTVNIVTHQNRTTTAILHNKDILCLKYKVVNTI